MKLAGWRSKVTVSLLVSLLLASSGSQANATTLPVHSALDNTTTPPLSAAIDLGGTQLATESIPFFNTTDVGTLTSTVVRNDASNPWGTSSGYLTFIFTLVNTGNPTNDDPFNRITLNGFKGFSVDASYVNQVGPGFMLPAQITRASNGSTVGVFYEPGYAAGTDFLNTGITSMQIVLHTNATAYTTTLEPVIGGGTSNVASYMPTVPEPGSVVLMLIGVGSLCLIGWRRRCSR
jgi:PEP-CTERM motif-containing protein